MGTRSMSSDTVRTRASLWMPAATTTFWPSMTRPSSSSTPVTTSSLLTSLLTVASTKLTPAARSLRSSASITPRASTAPSVGRCMVLSDLVSRRGLKPGMSCGSTSCHGLSYSSSAARIAW
ncbi:hypothetical protein ADK38_02385 [Streptomyces varsoviensis]|uniref:Uncharacterized protein n=1 Tax=Streptomyces varsoviensis TaxID=67373 RepID=A0ABR5JDS0_9ACTN|nr:hypothetical protein ADK38_02385 [Streptomyces varsoviensis]